MIALISFLVVVLFSLIVVKIGSVALESTGLSRDIAAFQAQSAFSGVGFTTEESETIMGHPLRRKILSYLMLIGSAGLTSAIATLILTFMNPGTTTIFGGVAVDRTAFNIIIILIVFLGVFGISRTRYFDKLVRWLLQKPLHIMKRKIAIYDYEKILGLSKGYTIASFDVPKRHWMVNRTIRQLELEKEGFIVLGVYRNVHGEQEYLGIPSQDFRIHTRDKMMVYCRESIIPDFAKREKGNKGRVEREEAVELHKKLEALKKLEEEKLAKVAKQQ